MKWWTIIKMIAEIIGNLPFNASEDQIKTAVVEKCNESKPQNKV